MSVPSGKHWKNRKSIKNIGTQEKKYMQIGKRYTIKFKVYINVSF